MSFGTLRTARLNEKQTRHFRELGDDEQNERTR